MCRDEVRNFPRAVSYSSAFSPDHHWLCLLASLFNPPSLQIGSGHVLVETFTYAWGSQDSYDVQHDSTLSCYYGQTTRAFTTTSTSLFARVAMRETCSADLGSCAYYTFLVQGIPQLDTGRRINIGWIKARYETSSTRRLFCVR